MDTTAPGHIPQFSKSCVSPGLVQLGITYTQSVPGGSQRNRGLGPVVVRFIVGGVADLRRINP
jgi:hypothetical protein